MIVPAALAFVSVLAADVPATAAKNAAPATTVDARRSDRCDLDAPYDRLNPFARILRGESPVSMVYEDTTLAAFLPIAWEHPGEVLIITRRPVRNLGQMTDAELLAVMHLVKRIAVAQQRILSATGFTVEENNGQTQGVCHVHFHVVPNTSGGSARPSRSELDEMAARLKAALP